MRETASKLDIMPLVLLTCPTGSDGAIKEGSIVCKLCNTGGTEVTVKWCSSGVLVKESSITDIYSGTPVGSKRSGG